MSKGFNEKKLAQAERIRDDLRAARTANATHVIRIINTDTDAEIVLQVASGNPRQAFADFVTANGTNFNPIECYDMSVDLENQVQLDRTVNWDTNLPVQTGPFSAVFPFGGNGPGQ